MHDHANCRDLFDQISAYLDGELDPEVCGQISSHVGSCEACLRFLESLRATRDTVRTLGEQPVVSEDECRRLLSECMETVRRRAAGGSAAGEP